MKITIEIGHNLLRAIEKVIDSNEHLIRNYHEYPTVSTESTGEAVKRALGIDFEKIVTEIKEVEWRTVDDLENNKCSEQRKVRNAFKQT